MTNAQRRRSVSAFVQIQESRVGGDWGDELSEGDRVCLEKVELLECWGFSNAHWWQGVDLIVGF